MRTDRLIILALVLALCAGCSSVSTNVDSGQVKATTFNFVKPPPREAFAGTDSMDAVHQAIQQNITRNLAGKGVQNVTASGDIVVAYLLVTGNNVTTRTYNEYFGADRGAAKLAEKAHVAYTQKNHGPNYFEAATLLVDVIDVRNTKLLRRKYVTRPIMANLTAQERAARIQAAVDEVLAGLQVVR